MIRQGQVVLPRFQRHEAWRHAQVIGLLENILRNPPLPIGALLTLEVGDAELFHSRPIVGAPPPASKAAMHLLDGQQRMTALWRSLTGDYRRDDVDVLLSLKAAEPDEEDEDGDGTDAPKIEVLRRWDRKGVLQPVWANDPVEMLERGFVPVTILCPGSSGEEALAAWEDAVEQSGLLDKKLTKRIEALRQRLAKYDIPFLSLGTGTSRGTALKVFINMNTSATPLKDFDIVVAQLESATGDSLHDMVEELVEGVPGVRDYGRIEDSVLSVAALLMGRPPLKITYLAPDFGEGFKTVWPRLKHGFKQGIGFLRSEKILNEQCLPSDVLVYLTCALWADVPEDGFDKSGNARALIRKALWRASFTNRYGKTSATRSYADYRVLRDAIAGKAFLSGSRAANGELVEAGKTFGGEEVVAGQTMVDGKTVLVCDLFELEQNPLPVIEEMVLAGWPGRKDRLPRAILAASLRRQALDFADGAPITHDNFHNREFHHLYPVGILSGDRADERANRALNCALITWMTNRKVAAKKPSVYVSERRAAASLGEEVVRHRLASHLVPYDALIADDYEAFLNQRAALVHADMVKLCEGAEPA